VSSASGEGAGSVDAGCRGASGEGDRANSSGGGGGGGAGGGGRVGDDCGSALVTTDIGGAGTAATAGGEMDAGVSGW
jgi:hypothetical protein